MRSCAAYCASQNKKCPKHSGGSTEHPQPSTPSHQYTMMTGNMAEMMQLKRKLAQQLGQVNHMISANMMTGPHQPIAPGPHQMMVSAPMQQGRSVPQQPPQSQKFTPFQAMPVQQGNCGGREEPELLHINDRLSDNKKLHMELMRTKAKLDMLMMEQQKQLQMMQPPGPRPNMLPPPGQLLPGGGGMVDPNVQLLQKQLQQQPPHHPGMMAGPGPQLRQPMNPAYSAMMAEQARKQMLMAKRRQATGGQMHTKQRQSKFPKLNQMIVTSQMQQSTPVMCPQPQTPVPLPPNILPRKSPKIPTTANSPAPVPTPVHSLVNVIIQDGRPNYISSTAPVPVTTNVPVPKTPPTPVQPSNPVADSGVKRLKTHGSKPLPSLQGWSANLDVLLNEMTEEILTKLKQYHGSNASWSHLQSMEAAVRRGEFRELSEEEVASKCTSTFAELAGEKPTERELPVTPTLPEIKTEQIHVKVESSPVLKLEPMDTEEDRKPNINLLQQSTEMKSGNTGSLSLLPPEKTSTSNGNVQIGNLQPVFFMLQKDQEDSENIDVNSFLANM